MHSKVALIQTYKSGFELLNRSKFEHIANRRCPRSYVITGTSGTTWILSPDFWDVIIWVLTDNNKVCKHICIKTAFQTIFPFAKVLKKEGNGFVSDSSAFLHWQLHNNDDVFPKHQRFLCNFFSKHTKGKCEAHVTCYENLYQ